MASEKSTGCSLKGGDEYDMLTKARQYYTRRPRDAKRAKRRFNRRVRREGHNDARAADPMDGEDNVHPVGREPR